MNYKVTVPEGRSGPWRVERFEVPDKPTIQNIRYMMHGLTPVPPGTYTRLIQDGAYEPMMSDTPAEIESHLAFIYQAKGKVLLNGLGLGMVLGALLAKPDVELIDVVEIDADIISLVWPSYSSDSRITLHQADALTITWPRNKQWDYAWHDIWANISSDNWGTMKALHRKYAHRVGFQDSWQRAWVRRLYRQDVSWWGRTP